MRYLAVVVLLNVFLAGLAFAGEKDHLFAIYKVKEDNKYLERVVLEDEPVVTEKDVLMYYRKDHRMVLSYAAMERLRAISPRVFGEGFVVVAGGERCYRGVFLSSALSVQSGLPTIIVDRPEDKKHLNEFTIERAYPSAEYGLGDDPRDNQRVMDVLKSIRKLKQ